MLLITIQEDLKQAQFDREEVKISTLRLLLSEIHNVQIAKGQELSDQDVISIIQKETKRRSEAASGFRSGGREEQALKEEQELKILEGYLPAQLSTEELTNIVQQAINEIGATSLQDMGKVRGKVMGKVKGQADGNVVSGIVRGKLTP